MLKEFFKNINSIYLMILHNFRELKHFEKSISFERNCLVDKLLEPLNIVKNRFRGFLWKFVLPIREVNREQNAW